MSLSRWHSRGCFDLAGQTAVQNPPERSQWRAYSLKLPHRLPNHKDCVEVVKKPNIIMYLTTFCYNHFNKLAVFYKNKTMDESVKSRISFGYNQIRFRKQQVKKLAKWKLTPLGLGLFCFSIESQTTLFLLGSANYTIRYL